MTQKKSNGKKTLGAFVAGAAAAAAAGAYYLYGPSGKKHRDKIAGWKIRAKGEVVEKIENTKELTEEKYNSIIDTVMRKYSKLKNVSNDQVDSLSHDLKQNWTKLKKEFDTTKKDTANKTKNK